jgi:hypothetical protein
MTQQRTRPHRQRRADLIVAAVETALVAVAIAVGVLLNRHGLRLYADAAPLYAAWDPHAGWGTPAAVLIAGVVVWWAPGWVRRASWPRLLTAGYLGALAWTLSLALVDGWQRGLAGRLTPQAEYLPEVPKAGPVSTMLAEFAGRILDFQPDSYATHTAGHPPGALLLFVWLDRIGLGGGGPAALCCVLIGATVAISVPVALRALGDEAAARAVLPFLVLFPGAVWVGASADGIFAAVVAAALALLAPQGRAPAYAESDNKVPFLTLGWGLLGGVLLGFALYLSYGFVLVGVLALTVIGLRRRGRLATLGNAAAGLAVVVAVFTLAGFWWPDGYHLVVQRYYQGWAADRPYGYWVWANLAALVLSAGPAVAPALRRSLADGWRRLTRAPLAGPAGRVVTWLPLAAAAVIAGADLSGLSKAEVERIWLPFAVWLLVATARLPAADRRCWLAAQAATALAVNHLLFTGW